MVIYGGNKLKAITIKQPWATLIAKGLKKYEFRTWNTKYRGDILIHAGKEIDHEVMKKYAHYKFDYPTGCFIAKARLTEVITISEDFRKILKKDNEEIYNGVVNTKWQGYGFKLEDVKIIKQITAKGQLGLWNYEGNDFNE